MESTKQFVKFDENKLKKDFAEACKNPKLKRLLKTIEVEEEIAMKYTSSLEETLEELEQSSNCPGIIDCQNRFEGHVLYPEKKGKQIIFSYAPCKYEKERREKEANRMTRDKELALASLKDIDKTDSKRLEVLKWIGNFATKYDRMIVYSKVKIFENYAVNIKYVRKKATIFGKAMPIKIY